MQKEWNTAHPCEFGPKDADPQLFHSRSGCRISNISVYGSGFKGSECSKLQNNVQLSSILIFLKLFLFSENCVLLNRKKCLYNFGYVSTIRFGFYVLYLRVSQKTKILGAQVFSILLCPRSPNMTTKFFSVIIKRYMSNLKIVILRPWTDSLS